MSNYIIIIIHIISIVIYGIPTKSTICKCFYKKPRILNDCHRYMLSEICYLNEHYFYKKLLIQNINLNKTL